MSNLNEIRNIILVLSGKGGVGKSTVAAQIACLLASQGHKVGLLDIDLCGPSIPKILGVENSAIHQCSAGWVPVYPDDSKNLGIMSIGFLLNSKDDAVIWRGPKKTAMIKQFLTDVYWEQLDYLIVDTPPGTSDEHIAIVESVQFVESAGAVLVTTPQNVATGDVRRQIDFCKKAKVKVLGIIENMSGFTCPHCKECSNIFSANGGEELAKLANVPFLGRIPIDPSLTEAMESGKTLRSVLDETETGQRFANIVKTITSSLQ